MKQDPLQDMIPETLDVGMGTPEEREAQRLLDAYLEEIQGKGWNTHSRDLPAGEAILSSAPRTQIALLFAIQSSHLAPWQVRNLKSDLFARNLPWTADDLERLLQHCKEESPWRNEWEVLLRHLKRFVEQGNIPTPDMEASLHALVAKLNITSGSDVRKLRAGFRALLGEDQEVLPAPGTAWSDAALADIATRKEETRKAWKRLFAHAQNSESTTPTSAWRKEGRACVAVLGDEAFCEGIARWFPLVTAPPMRTVRHESNGHTWESSQSSGSDQNTSMLKGLGWLCADRTEIEIARALARLAEGCLKKQPGIGPWAVRAALGAIWALTEMDCPEAIGQLGRLKTKVTFRTALRAIEKGLETAAQRAGVSKADLEDLSVPGYGFATDGTRREAFGECAATATLTPQGGIVLQWFGANSKPIKSIPTAIKKNYAAELKEFQADVDAADKMLTAQKARFDGFYLPERVWTWRDWQDRFGSHPILGHIAGRLIWHFSEPESRRKTQGIWSDTQNCFVDVHEQPIAWQNDRTEIRLWHPMGSAAAEVLAWRAYLQNQEIVQPFKQAYREVYPLTDAELQTHTYSNRFAGHVLKQHQMNSLAALRGWKNKLRLMVDDSYPPASKELPELGLRAEFWIEGAGEEYGVDTTESGSFLYLTTDQVRFYSIAAPENYAHAGGGGYSGSLWGANREPAPPLPLTEVPALAFSEIMRDVDLFVGVCSVGNDPTWQDGGPQGRYHDYWENYSFGGLSASAQTRYTVLAQLLPRLKISERCTLKDRFLQVRGDLRTYKIHLGSGNILMEPNDEYLCIVQDRSAARTEPSVPFLPFEGDQRLALILSKAFLLANDSHISDPTIARQIKR